MDHELYEIFLANIKEKLFNVVRGIISVTKDDRNIYISIYRFGYYWNYVIYNVDLMDVNTLSSDKTVETIVSSYRAFVNDSYFVV